MMKQNLKQPKLTGGTSTHRNNLVMSFLRTFLFLAVMAIGTGSAWGQTVLGKAEISAAPESTSEKTAMTTNGVIVGAWYQDLTVETNDGITNGGKNIGDKWFVKLTNVGKITIRVTKGSVVAGDILKVETIDIYQNVTNQDLGFGVEGSNSSVTVKETNNALHIVEYTLKATDIRKDTENSSYDYIQLNRNEKSGCGYHSVSIERPSTSILNITDLFHNGSNPGISNSQGMWVCSNATLFWTAGLLGSENANVRTVEGKKFVQLGRDANKYLKIQFDKGKIKAGDKIQMEVIRCVDNQDMGFFTVKEGKPNEVKDYNGQLMPNANYPNQNTVYTLNYTIEAADINTVDANTENIIITGWWNNSTAFHNLRIYRNSYTVTFAPNNGDWGTVTATANGNPIASGSSVAHNTRVTFTATPKSSDYLTWGWSGDATNYAATATVTATKDISVTHNFTPGIKINAYPNDGTLGSINISGGGQNGTSIHVTPYPGTVTFTATPNPGARFVGWYSNVELTNLVTAETTLSYKDNEPADDTNFLRKAGEFNRWAKFEATGFKVTANWGLTIPSNTFGWGVPMFTVKYNNEVVSADDYTLNFEVVDGEITVFNDNGEDKVRVNNNWAGTAHIRVTAVPNDPSRYEEGSMILPVTVLPAASPQITVQVNGKNNKNVRIGEVVKLGVTRNTGFNDPVYTWSLSSNAAASLHGTEALNAQTGEDNRNISFVAGESATSTSIDVNLTFQSSVNWPSQSGGEHASLTGWNGITVQPVARPIISEDIDGIHFKVEEDYDGIEIDEKTQKVDVYLEYWTEDETFEKRHIVGWDGNGTGSDLVNGETTISSIGQGKTIYAQACVAYTDAERDIHYVSSEQVTYVTETASSLPEFDQIKQPRFKAGIAKQYISFTNNMKVVGGNDDGETVSNVMPDGVISSSVISGKAALTDGNDKKTLGYILGGNRYPYSKEKGVCISRFGKAHWAWSAAVGDPNRQWLPKSGAFFLQVAGTMDIVLYAENTFHDSENTTDGDEGNRRTIKAWYLNDQCKDGKPIEFKDWGIVGIRHEGNYANGGNGAELALHVRLPQLGTDGIATIFFTYEGDGFKNEANDTNHDLWIKGFMVKRPDLRVSIGRTDNKYAGDADANVKLCVTTPNTPYVWSFEPTVKNHKNENIHVDGLDAVGFRPASDTEKKKNNVNDGRIYVCGDQCDHVLIFSDNYDEDPENPVTPLTEAERPQLDGRYNRDGNSHIEFVRPTIIAGNNGNDNKFNPIRSNGLKVNVTGSGWFKVFAAAPYCDVKMKVLTSTNGGESTIRVLKEFIVKKSSETGWTDPNVESEFTAYLKAQVTNDNTYDEDDATGDPEKKYMSLYVVFEAANANDLNPDGTVKAHPTEYPQLNIHQMSWLNEEPADYVFQREENPKLLTEWRKIKRNNETVLWWKAGNDDDAAYPMLKEKNTATYNRLDQFNTSIADGKGVKSPDGYASTSVPSDAGTYDAYWDIAAPASTHAHTEKAYGGNPNYNSGTEYIYNGANNTEFDTPVSGSFIRICAMQNTYVVAHVLPGAAGGNVYVLDETGSPLGFDSSTDDAKRHGYIAAMSNVTGSGVDRRSTDGTIRIDFCANAGKEYFICANGASISLARLEVQDWRYKPTKSASTLALADNTNNSSAITGAYDSKEFYRDAMLTRKFAANTWASLVLPFSLNEKKFEEVFGVGAKCLHFTDVNISTNVTKLTHHYYNMIVAGRPVFVLPTKTYSTSVSFDDITLQANDVRTTTTEDNKFEFFASYDNSDISKNDLYLNNANAIQYYAKTSSTYPGMRSFIKNLAGYDFATGVSSSPAKTVFLSFADLDEDIVTGIEELITPDFGENVVVITKSTKVYDLLGNPVADGSRIDSLPAGIYIVNGKKLVVK